MKPCPRCSEGLDNNAVGCPGCGASLETEVIVQGPEPGSFRQRRATFFDTEPGAGLAALGVGGFVGYLLAGWAGMQVGLVAIAALLVALIVLALLH